MPVHGEFACWVVVSVPSEVLQPSCIQESKRGPFVFRRVGANLETDFSNWHSVSEDLACAHNC